MTTFLFWNINRRPIANLIADVVDTHEVDFLMIAESEITNSELLPKLNKDQRSIYFPEPLLSNYLKIYSRYSPQFIRPVTDSGRITIRHLTFPSGKDILIVAVHLPSKLYQSDQDQAFYCTRLARLIEEAETTVGHSRTIVVGDFNMNPFEPGMVGAEGLNAVMDRGIAQRGVRRVQERECKFFYNPMWSYLGDFSPGPPGTYYRNTGRQVNFFWNMFDQILIRPEIMDAFENENMRILTEIGQASLLGKYGKPDVNTGSDHLPIYFRINI